MGKKVQNIDLVEKVASRIKELREKKGISTDKFYIESDINIARIERGERAISLVTLHRVCEYLEITLTDFFKGIKI